jgi:hypothetical protein
MREAGKREKGICLDWELRFVAEGEERKGKKVAESRAEGVRWMASARSDPARAALPACPGAGMV